MTAPETPSPSPLTPEERYEVDALLARHEAAAARTYGSPIQPSAWRRLLDERDSLAARVSDLEAAARVVVNETPPGAIFHHDMSIPMPSEDCSGCRIRVALLALDEVLRAR